MHSPAGTGGPPRFDPVTDVVTFHVPADEGWTPARLWFHLRDFGADPTFHRDGDGWVAQIPRPPVDRMEYLLVLTGTDGSEVMVPDPANPVTVPSVFGDKSVIDFPGYRPPWWVPTGEASPRAHQFEVVDPGIAVVDTDAEVEINGLLLAPVGSTSDEPLPLLVVHDGPEYAQLAQLLDYLEAITPLEPDLACRVLLLRPVDRDRSYSASPAYARALMSAALPRVTGSVSTRGLPVGVGCSLGALAMLHAAASYPGSFAGLFAQSGSFFQARTDPMERGYRFFDRVMAFVDHIDADPRRLAGLRVAMTCGTGEENLANNRALARRLTGLGVPTTLVENPDAHNHTGWRDALDPSLRQLMREAWGRTGNAGP